MSEHDDSVAPVLMTADSPQEAQVVAALLRAAEIPVYVSGRMLQDEFALSQALMGLTAVEICVPAEFLDQARRAIDSAREQGSLGDGADEDGSN